MTTEIKPVYEYSDGIYVEWVTTPEQAIMSSFLSEFPPANKYGELLHSPAELPRMTMVKRVWGIYIDNQLYRVSESEAQIYRDLEKLREVVKEIGALKEGEEMSYKSLFENS